MRMVQIRLPYPSSWLLPAGRWQEYPRLTVWIHPLQARGI
jgi:hypothetical protein